MKRQVWIFLTVLLLTALVIRSQQEPVKPSSAASPEVRRITTNICGVQLGMDQMEVIKMSPKFGGHLEPLGSFPYHLISIKQNEPLLINYTDSSEVRWISGPSIQFENGTTLYSEDSLTEIRKKLNSHQGEVQESVSDLLCDGAIQEFNVGGEIVISERKDGTFVFSLGPLDGWPTARKDGLTWEGLREKI